MDFLITVLTVYGISAIVTQSKIFEPLRDLTEKHSPNFWSYLTSCMQCFPFWAGIFVSWLLSSPVQISTELIPGLFNTILTYLLTGGLFSGTTMLIHTLYIYMLGDIWIEKQKKERQRKLDKRIIS